jgi:hypothetical protein
MLSIVLKLWRRTVLILVALALTMPVVSRARKPAPSPKPPSASTGGAVQVSYTAATLNATIDPHGSETSYYFQYGPTPSYGGQTAPTPAGNGSVGVQVSQAISGLQLGTVYHYRVVAASVIGPTQGQDHIFTTRRLALKFEISRQPRLTVFGSRLSIEGTLTGTGNAGQQVVLQESPYPFLASFSDLGNPQTTGPGGGFSFPVTGLAQNTQLRVVTLGTPPIYSPALTVRVATRVTLHAHPTGRPGVVRLYGTITPAPTGASVGFQLLRPGRAPTVVDGTTVKRVNAHVARFSAVLFVRHGRGGAYRAVASVTDGSYAPGYSRAVTVHAAPAPARPVHRARRRGSTRA